MSRHDPKANCPTPWKKRHPTEWQAENALSSMWRHRRHGGPLPTRVYPCDCGGYHTTHLTLAEHEARVGRRPQPPRGA